MRRSLLLAFLAAIFLSTPVHAQNKVDFWLRDAIQRHERQPAAVLQKQSGSAIVASASGKIMIEVIVQSNNGDFSFVEQNGGVLRTVAGPYATCLIPLAAFDQIASHPQIQYCAGATKLHPLNDVATQLTGVKDAIRAGYTGAGVIIGVIDSGIDINHPGFKNASGTRILYLWDQTEGNQGTGGPRYDYGTEWTKTQIDRGECNSKDTVGHGTHIAGCIAQHVESGRDSLYSGGAIAANLVIVKTDFLSTHILDGINYIFERAREAGKPAIVNLSLGSQLGPHDGTDPISVARDFLSGPGRIIVQSAGNDADKAIHHKVDADGNGEDMQFSTTAHAGILEFELWYAGNRNVDLQILGPNGNPNVSVPSGAAGSVSIPGGTLTADNASNGPEFYNNDKRIGVKLEGRVEPGTWTFRLTSPITTTVHAWMWNGDPAAGFRFATDDDHYTLINGACGRTVIAVGAYVTRNRFRVKNVEGIPDSTELFSGETLNTVASFSSGGPTRDGRQKPDLVAPGSYIVSAMSGDIVLNAAKTRRSDYRAEGQLYQFLDGDQQLLVQGSSPASAEEVATLAPVVEIMEQQGLGIDPSGLQALIRENGECMGAYQHGSHKLAASACPWDYRAGFGLFKLHKILALQSPITSSKQIGPNLLEVGFNTVPPGADQAANYTIEGASAVSIISTTRTGNVITLELSGALREGVRDYLRITGLPGLTEPINIEIDKFGKIVEPEQVITNLTWHADESPYYVHGEIQIPDMIGDQKIRLTIEPGTVVKFMPNDAEPSQLSFFGELIARGTAENPIIFTSLDETENGAWGGLYFDRDIPPTTLQFCEIRYADTGITCFSDNLTVENCTISHSRNTGFFAQDCSPKIVDTTIRDSNGGNLADGIQLVNATSATLIEGVRILDNARIGIACFSSNPQIKKSIIANNFDGIQLQGATPEARLTNLTIHGNARGGVVNFSSNPQIVNCIVSNNAGPGIHSQEGTPPAVTYTDALGNNPNFSGVVPGTGVIMLNPQYRNAAAGDFRLQQNSPCVNTGDPSPAFIDLDGTRADMGALPRLAELTTFGAAAISGGIELTWSAGQNEKVEGVVILRKQSEPVQAVLQNGVGYAVGESIGNATVIYSMPGGTDPGRFLDLNVEASATYHYAAWAIYGNAVYSDDPLPASAVTAVAAGQGESELPSTFALHQNYPNPFNPSTVIRFDLPKASEVDIRAFNLQGQLVRILVHERRPAGRHVIAWNGKLGASRAASNGIYVIQMRAGDFEKSIKATLIK